MNKLLGSQKKWERDKKAENDVGIIKQEPATQNLLSDTYDSSPRGRAHPSSSVCAHKILHYNIFYRPESKA